MGATFVAYFSSSRKIFSLLTNPTATLTTNVRVAESTSLSLEAMVSPSVTPQVYINQQSPTQTPVVFTNTPGADGVIRYQVQLDDTLETIAANYNLDANDLRAINSMTGDMLIAGQFITIPLQSPVALPPWKFSTTTSNLEQDYPLFVDIGRFTLHYQPDTFPAQDPNTLVQLETDGLTFIESLTNLKLTDKYDVYVAGSNFDPPSQALRGITFSSIRRTFFLHDGTGDADDQRYILTHELTHLFMWNTSGSPASAMLSEGTAVYFGMESINGSKHLPLETFCAAYYKVNVLPKVSGSLSFLGHITDLQNYYASGCFIKFLVDAYGVNSLISVYHNGNYQSVFGRNINDLENDWKNHLSSIQIPVELDPKELIVSVTDLESSYKSFFSKFNGDPAQLEAYRQLDNARIALLEGRLTEMHNFLASFNEIK